MYDVIIIGGGPAGLAAAVYMARAKYKTLVIEKEKIGGLITITSEVVNYPGVLKTTGKELTEQMRLQAESFGAEFLLAEALESKLDCDIKEVHTDKGTFKSLGVIMAMGAVPRQVGFTGESEYRGRGVAYCATCDGEFFTGLDVFVVGGGFAAAEEAIFLTRYARHVTVLVRGDDFTCAGSIADEAKRHEQITVLYNSAMLEVGGGDVLRYAVYENFKDLEDAQKVDEKKQAERQKKIQDSTEYYKHADAKPGSIAAKARMVQQFDEKNPKGKKNKN